MKRMAMFENISEFFKRFMQNDKKELLAENPTSQSKETAKDRLHVVLMQDRANVSADFLELMKEEIIEVIKKYIVVDESKIDVRLTNEENDDGSLGAPLLHANIPILNVRNDLKGTYMNGAPADKIEGQEEINFDANNEKEEIANEENYPEVQSVETVARETTENEENQSEVQLTETLEEEVTKKEENVSEIAEETVEKELEEKIEEILAETIEETAEEKTESIEENSEENSIEEVKSEETIAQEVNDEELDDDVTFDDLLKAAEEEEKRLKQEALEKNEEENEEKKKKSTSKKKTVQKKKKTSKSSKK